MLAAENRLKQARDISRVFQRGRFGGAGELTAKAAVTKALESRAVVIVGKKVSKKAVVRNRIRRRIAGILESKWKTVPPGYDIVITVRQDIGEMPAKELEERVLAVLKKAGVIRS